MRYHQMGRVPRKRHVQFRDPEHAGSNGNAPLLVEEVLGFEGFSGNESILYHLFSPCRVKEVGAFTPRTLEEWVPETHVHRLTNTNGAAPQGDSLLGRRVLEYNNDVEIGICLPEREADYFFRDGEGDEVIFVHEGEGVVETIFGALPYRKWDYVVIPRGTTYRFRFDTPQRWLTFYTPGEIETPNRYRNRYGQLLERSPFSHRDFHPPVELKTHRERGEFMVKVRVRGGYQDYVLDYHPFGSRKGVDIGAITLHPSGLPHGPQPGLVEKSLGAKRTEELAVMWDTFRPLKLTPLSRELDQPDYALSWY